MEHQGNLWNFLPFKSFRNKVYSLLTEGFAFMVLTNGKERDQRPLLSILLAL